MKQIFFVFSATLLFLTGCIDSDYPFDTVSDTVNIDYTLESDGTVDVMVTDSFLGTVATLVNGQEQNSGSQSVAWDLADDSGNPVENGLYNVEVYLGGERIDVQILEVSR